MPIYLHVIFVTVGVITVLTIGGVGRELFKHHQKRRGIDRMCPHGYVDWENCPDCRH